MFDGISQLPENWKLNSLRRMIFQICPENFKTINTRILFEYIVQELCKKTGLSMFKCKFPLPKFLNSTLFLLFSASYMYNFIFILQDCTIFFLSSYLKMENCKLIFQKTILWWILHCCNGALTILTERFSTVPIEGGKPRPPWAPAPHRN